MARKKPIKKPEEPRIIEESKEGVKVDGEHAPANKMGSFYLRTITTIIMLVGFILILTLGHFYCALFVITLMIFCFKELKALKMKKELDKNIPHFNIINWYFFVCFVFFILPMYLPNQTKLGVTDPTLLELFKYHKLISFLAFILGVLLFTWSLEKATYKYQFKMLGWSFLILLVVVCQACSLVYNIYKGLFWFIFPALCVVCNDIFAYIFGFFMGKTPLIKLSPKKTWEGFIGGAMSTLVWAFVTSWYLTQFPALVCPQTRMTYDPFVFPSCQEGSVFTPKQYNLPFPIMGNEFIMIAPVQWHAIILALFSSLIAPFGGFFASGLKRAFKIKDFGTTIPGHGGITDRFDCQIMMSMFTFVYLHEVVFRINPSVDAVMNSVYKLSHEEQLLIFNELKSNIIGA